MSNVRRKWSLILLVTVTIFLSACVPATGPPQKYVHNSAQQQRYINQLRDRGVQVVQVGDDIRIILSVDNYFLQNNQINPHYKPTLAAIADLLKTYATRHIVITGHTDQIGSDKMRLDRSKSIAHKIASYLWAQGIPLAAMTIKGESNHQQVASDQTVFGAAANRRIEIEASH